MTIKDIRDEIEKVYNDEEEMDLIGKEQCGIRGEEYSAGYYSAINDILLMLMNIENEDLAVKASEGYFNQLFEDDKIFVGDLLELIFKKTKVFND